MYHMPKMTHSYLLVADMCRCVSSYHVDTAKVLDQRITRGMPNVCGEEAWKKSDSIGLAFLSIEDSFGFTVPSENLP